MTDTETSIGTFLDEIFAKYNSQISSLQSRIYKLESKLSALECLGKIPNSADSTSDEPIANSQHTNTERSLSPSIEQSTCHQDTNSKTVGENSIMNNGNSSVIAPILADSCEEFLATPQLWQGDIALRQNDDRSNSIFKVKFAQNEGVVEFNQEAFASLSGQIEGLLLPYVEYEILSGGVPSCINTIENGSAHFDGNIWWLKKKAKVVIQ